MSADRETSTLLLISSQHQAQGPVGIQHLPVEVLQKVLVYSHSSSLPFVCQYFRQACQSASDQIRSEYIFERWLDTLERSIAGIPCRRKHKACKKLASQIAAIEHQSSSFELSDCAAGLVRENRLDIITFAAEFRISTAKVLKRVVSLTKISLPPKLSEFVLPPLERPHLLLPEEIKARQRRLQDDQYFPVPQLPKRLFRRIDQFDDDHSRPKKRRKLGGCATAEDEREGDEDEDEDEEEQHLGRSTRSRAQLKKLAWSIAKASRYSGIDDLDEADRRKYEELDGEEAKGLRRIVGSASRSVVGPVPSAEDLDMILTLLLFYNADGSSHQGFPLVMAAQHRAFALAHLLLIFGADPTEKEGLAAKIAIRNGSRDILRLFVTGHYYSMFVIHALGELSTVSAPVPLRLDASHLKVAIQYDQRDLIDYIWHKQGVAPDMKCLELLQKQEQERRQ